AGSCVASSCTDGVQNGSETAVDCGGACPGCDVGMPCTVNTDCRSGHCAQGTCGMFAPPMGFAAFADALAAGDLDGDGKQDFASVNQGNNGGLDGYLSLGTGAFMYASHQGVFAANGLALADFNGDGRLDAVVGQNTGPNNVTLLLGTGAGGFNVNNIYSAG